MPQSLSLRAKQQLYRKILVEEFIREYNFLADVLAGRATAKADFTDKLMKVLSFGVSNAVGAVPLPGFSIVAGALGIVIDWTNDQRIDHKPTLEKQQVDMEQEQLRILIDTVAFEASRRYEFVLATKLSDTPTEAIIPFAKAGVERMLHYVARYRLPLTADNLLHGLVAGQSGAYVSGFRNTRLVGKDPKKKIIYTAEGVYERSALMTPDKRYWVANKKGTIKKNTPKKPKVKGDITPEPQKKQLFVKFDKHTKTDPKYGFVLAPIKIVEFYFDTNKTEQSLPTLSTSLQQDLKNNPPSMPTITRQNLEAYVETGKKGSLIAFLKKTYPACEMAVFEPDNPSDLDLSRLDLSGADLSHCVFNGVKLAGSLTNTQFQYASLIGADVSKVTSAKGANFTGAHLEYLKAAGADLSGSDLTSAQLHYANCTGCKFIKVQFVGAIWLGAILTGIQTEEQTAGQTIQKNQQQQYEALLEQQKQLKALAHKVQQQDETLTRLQGLVTRLEKQQVRLEDSQDVKAKEQAQKMQAILDELLQEKSNRETFARYCQAELKRLHQESKKTDDKFDMQQEQIQQLQEQLKHSHAQPAQLPELVRQFDTVFHRLESQQAVENKLSQDVNQLEERVGHYVQSQQEQIDHVFAGLTALQQEVEQFKEDVRRELKAQEEHHQKDFQDVNKRLADMEERLRRMQPISIDERGAIIQQKFAAMTSQATALQLNQAAPKPPIDPRHAISYLDLEFHQRIAVGSFAKVYLGRWCEQAVAIKMLEGNLTDAEKKEFIREVNIMSRLRNPNIVEFFGACLETQRACLVMEYMFNGSLYQLLEKEHLNPEKQKQLALEIARGLHYLHSQHVLHRDLKSGNILISKHGEAKITDFGLAKVNYTSVQSIQKTTEDIQWQSPEHLLGQPYTEKSDIYSFGIILWELCTQKKPYAGLEGPALIEAIKSGKHDPIPADVPQVFRKLIEQCWQSDPQQRPNTANIIHAIESYQPRPASPTPEAYYEQGLAAEKQKHYADAFRFYKRSIEKGDYPRAHTNIGNFFRQGVGDTPVNKAEAFAHFLKAAESGHARGMFNAAMMLEKGDGVPQNIAEAVRWYDAADAATVNGDKEAKSRANKLRPLLQNTVVEHYRGNESTVKQSRGM